MQTITKSVNYSLKWRLKFAQHYALTSCGKMFNTRTGKEIKKTVNAYSIGYWILGKFYTLNALICHLEKIKKESCPF